MLKDLVTSLALKRLVLDYEVDVVQMKAVVLTTAHPFLDSGLYVAVTTFGLVAPFPVESQKTADVVVEGRLEENELRPVLMLEVVIDECDVVHLGFVGIVVNLMDSLLDQCLMPHDQSFLVVRTCTEYSICLV